MKNDKALQWLRTLPAAPTIAINYRLFLMSDYKLGRDIFLLAETSGARPASGGHTLNMGVHKCTQQICSETQLHLTFLPTTLYPTAIQLDFCISLQ